MPGIIRLSILDSDGSETRITPSPFGFIIEFGTGSYPQSGTGDHGRDNDFQGPGILAMGGQRGGKYKGFFVKTGFKLNLDSFQFEPGQEPPKLSGVKLLLTILVGGAALDKASDGQITKGVIGIIKLIIGAAKNQNKQDVPQNNPVSSNTGKSIEEQ